MLDQPPKGGGAAGGGGGEGEAFSRLLQQLHEQHQRELAELRVTIEGLRLAATQPPQAVRASGDWITAQISECIRAGDGEVPEPRSQGSPASVVATGGEQVAVSNDIDVTAVAEDACRDHQEHEARWGTPAPSTPKETKTIGSPSSRSSPRARVQKHHSRLDDIFSKHEERSTRRAEGFVDVAIGVCILLNIAVMFCRSEYDGYKTAVEVGLEAPGKWPDLALFFKVSAHVFAAIFAIELVLRLAYFRKRFFYDDDHIQKFNIFDALVVLGTLIDMYLLNMFEQSARHHDLTVMRAIRFARLLRAMRVVRTFEVFAKLRVLFSTVAASFYALMWSMVLLFVTMLMAAMLLTQLVKTHLTDPDMSGDMVEWIFKYYGTAGRALWTMFEVTFSGGWPSYARPLVEEVSSGFAFFFAVYVSCVVFAMTRIITALFLKDTLEVASNDTEMMIHEKMREKKTLASKLLDVFLVADTSGDGKISWEEFQTFFSDPMIKSYMATLELDAQESRTLFTMLDDGDGMVTAEEFVQGAVRLKGSARSQDVVQMMHDCNRLVKALDHVMKSLEHLHVKAETMEHVKQSVAALHEKVA